MKDVWWKHWEMDKGHPEGILLNKPCILYPTRNPLNMNYFNSWGGAWVRVFPRQCFLQKVPYEEETTGDLVLKILPISSNWKMMRSTDFLFFSSEKWHPKALKCPWKYGGPAFHRRSQHTVLNGEMLSSCFLANPFRLLTFGSESPPELNGLFPITCTCH